MTTKSKRLLLLNLVIITLIYLSTSFTTLESNPFLWEESVRFMTTFIISVVIVISLGYYYDSK